MSDSSVESVLQMGFEQWSELAQTDLDAFEEMRLAAIESVIQSADPKQRRRLRGLQWQIDQTRTRANNPLAACIRLSDMMWRALSGPGGLMDSLNQPEQSREGAANREKNGRAFAIWPEAAGLN